MTDSGLATNPGPLGLYSDAARRISDTVHLHMTADQLGNHKRWIAVRLSDGGSDGVVYDNPADAADHQLHYKQCAYIQLQLGGMGPKAAEVMLQYTRRVYDARNVPPALVAYQRAKLVLPGRNVR